MENIQERISVIALTMEKIAQQREITMTVKKKQQA